MQTASTHTQKPPYHSHALISIIKMPLNSQADVHCKNAFFAKPLAAKPVKSGKILDVLG